MASALLQGSSFLAGSRAPLQSRNSLAGRALAAPCNGCRVQAKAGKWLPGATTPGYLEEAPGSFGFDPLGLAKNPSNLQRFQESELIHSRWAMAGVAGALAVELLGLGDWYSAPLWVFDPNGKPTWLGIEIPLDIGAIAGIEFILIAAAEIFRNGESDPEKKKYPGGAFDPLGLSKNSAILEENKLKELKNGRLAMLAFIGFVAQQAVTKQSPLQALGTHLADPWRNNFATNGVSLPLPKSWL